MVEVAVTLVEHPEWIRGHARVEGREIVLDESRAERYWLHGAEGLEQMPFDLAAMSLHRSGRDPQQAVAFVRRYGLLWHGAAELGSGNCRESLDEWWHEAEKLFIVLRVFAELGESVREGSAERVRHFFEAFGLSFGASNDSYLMAATTIVARHLNQGLQKGHWGMVTVRPGELKLAYYPKDLPGAAYADVAALVATKAEFKECPGCGRIFPPDSGKQKFHNPQCATRARQRRWKREKSG